MPVVLTGHDLTLTDVRAVAREGVEVQLSAEARDRVAAGRAVVTSAFAAGRRVYGLNTGVGVLKRVDLQDDIAEFQSKFLGMHLIGQGDPYAPEIVRAAVLRLANQFALGSAGVRPELVDRLVSWLNRAGTARVRHIGGSLITNAELAVEVIGDFQLAEGEALALLGNSSFLDGMAALALGDLLDLICAWEAAAAMSLEAFRANISPLDPRVVALKGGQGLEESARRLRLFLEGTLLWQEDARRNLQDPVSFRAVGYVLGALRDALRYAQETMAVQLNSSSGNPVVVIDDDDILHAANWEVATVTTMIDFVKVSLAAVATMSQERSIKLLDRMWSGLPTGLVAVDGRGDSGLAMYQIVASSLTVELRSIAAPTSFDLASTSQAEGIEDRSHWGQFAARRLLAMRDLAQRILAIELLVSAQALDLQDAEMFGPRVRHIHELVRGAIPFMESGGPVPRELDSLIDLIRGRAFESLFA
jgi:histidine ammonia-lyase